MIQQNHKKEKDKLLSAQRKERSDDGGGLEL